MKSAIDQIVDAYVGLGNLRALQDLKLHRVNLAASVRSRTDFDFAVLLGQIDDDIVAIDKGLEQLRRRAATRDE